MHLFSVAQAAGIFQGHDYPSTHGSRAPRGSGNELTNLVKVDPGVGRGPLAWMASGNAAIDSHDHEVESHLGASRLSSTASLPPVGIIPTAKLGEERLDAWANDSDAVFMMREVVAPRCPVRYRHRQRSRPWAQWQGGVVGGDVVQEFPHLVMHALRRAPQSHGLCLG